MKTIEEQREKNKAYQKNYNKENSEKNKAYQKEYYKKHKEKLLTNLSEKVNCEFCGRHVCKYLMSKHLLSKLCRKTVETKKTIETKKENYFKETQNNL
jgi:hypothetical protein